MGRKVKQRATDALTRTALGKVPSALLRAIGDEDLAPSTNSDSSVTRRSRRLRSSAPKTPDGASEPWGQVGAETDPLRRSLDHEPATVCALLMLRNAFLAAPGFLAAAMQPGAVSIIQVADVAWGHRIGRALRLVVEAIDQTRDPGERTVDSGGLSARWPEGFTPASEWSRSISSPDQFLIFETPVRPAHSAEVFHAAVSAGKAVHVLSQDPDRLLPSDILLAEEGRLVVPPPNNGVLMLLAAVLETGASVPLSRLSEISGSPPDKMAEVSPFLVNLAHRKGLDAASFLRRLGNLVGRHQARLAAAEQPPALTLDDLPGQGEAADWGNQLAADLGAYARGALAWSDVDRGIVLEGPPGTGKSSFARALAGSAGVPLVSASLAQWQGSREGHLGNLLAAMRASFSEARTKAPCIFLLDEVDSFPTRASITHKHRDYVVEVINALLGELDGADERVGVVVVATCNDASTLDPALTRAGRLERIIRLDRPDAPALEQILRVHLRDALRAEDLLPAARTAALQGAVGADIERWCRGARRRARSAGRPVELADLINEVGPAPAAHTRNAVRRMAVHEAGHVLAFSLLGAGTVQQVVVDPTVGGLSRTTVDLAGLLRGAPYVTRRDVGSQLRAILSGRAAEEMLLGVPSGGAGGSHGSDLARATQLACSVVMAAGLDDGPQALLFLAASDDQERFRHLLLMPEVRQRVSAVLSNAYAEALVLVREHRDAVERVAAALVEHGHLSGPEAESYLSLWAPGSVSPEDRS